MMGKPNGASTEANQKLCMAADPGRSTAPGLFFVMREAEVRTAVEALEELRGSLKGLTELDKVGKWSREYRKKKALEAAEELLDRVDNVLGEIEIDPDPEPWDDEMPDRGPSGPTGWTGPLPGAFAMSGVITAVSGYYGP